MSYWTDTWAGPGHLTRFGWREALRAGPAGWEDIVTWRTLRVAAGVVLPLAAGDASGHEDRCSGGSADESYPWLDDGSVTAKDIPTAGSPCLDFARFSLGSICPMHSASAAGGNTVMALLIKLPAGGEFHIWNRWLGAARLRDSFLRISR